MECSICCESFNRSTRRYIKCKTCESEEVKVCMSCAKVYILDKSKEPSCMVCGIEWDDEFMSDNFTKVFISNELKTHRENYQLEKQMMLLPETQEYAEQLKMIEGLRFQKSILNERYLEEQRLADKTLSSVKELEGTINVLINDCSTLKGVGHVKMLSIKCPVSCCEGYMDKSYSCGMCENKICKECLDVEEEGHVCDKERKESVEFLKKDSKGCPKCGEFIHKLPNGCDQMYCIRCHTAFSWKTGIIDTGAVHNPEYYRWMRENGKDIPRNPLDLINNPCGDVIITYYDMLRIIRTWFPHIRCAETSRIIDDPAVIKMSNIHRLVRHAEMLERTKVNDEQRDELTLRNHRANILLNKETREEFKVFLQKFYKNKNRIKKNGDIWIVLRLVLVEFLRKIANINTNNINEGRQAVKEIFIECENIVKFCNASFKKVGKIYNGTYEGINDDMIHILNWSAYIKMLNK